MTSLTYPEVHSVGSLKAMPRTLPQPTPPPVTEATIRCPQCGHQALERMPENACLYFYLCTGCGERLKPKPGDCCVFCSYADALCPPKQAG